MLNKTITELYNLIFKYLFYKQKWYLVLCFDGMNELDYFCWNLNFISCSDQFVIIAKKTWVTEVGCHKLLSALSLNWLLGLGKKLSESTLKCFHSEKPKMFEMVWNTKFHY